MADPRDLCTIDDVKNLMQKAGPNASTQDPLIQSLITRASVKIMRDYGREFVPGGATGEAAVGASRIFEVDRDMLTQAFVDLSPYDLQTGTTPTVVMDPDLASSLTLQAFQYRLWPVPPLLGVYSAVRVSMYGVRGSYPPFTHRQVQVTGNWGFPTIPPDVTQAAAETVVHWIGSFPAARRLEQVDAPEGAYTPRSLPMSAVDLLRDFRRVVV